jgi:hypothetical protein
MFLSYYSKKTPKGENQEFSTTAIKLLKLSKNFLNSGVEKETLPTTFCEGTLFCKSAYVDTLIPCLFCRYISLIGQPQLELELNSMISSFQQPILKKKPELLSLSDPDPEPCPFRIATKKLCASAELAKWK